MRIAGKTIWSDAGDNPGGGGTGQTTTLLRKLYEAKAENVLYGNLLRAANRRGCAGQA